MKNSGGKRKEFELDTSHCFNWEKSVEVTLKLKLLSEEIASISYKRGEQERRKVLPIKHRGDTLLNIPVNFDSENTIEIEYKK